MRLLMMLATTVLLAACVHDTDGFALLVPEEGVSLTYHMGAFSSDKDDDPWDTINDRFGSETVNTNKELIGSGDPWDTIDQKFPNESVNTGSGSKSFEDPWDSINEKFANEGLHLEKADDDGYFLGVKKSEAVFVAFDPDDPTVGLAEVVEMRRRVLKLVFADGCEQFVVDAPAGWGVGTVLETGFLGAVSKDDLPFLGVRFWRLTNGLKPVSTLKEGL